MARAKEKKEQNDERAAVPPANAPLCNFELIRHSGPERTFFFLFFSCVLLVVVVACVDNGTQLAGQRDSRNSCGGLATAAAD